MIYCLIALKTNVNILNHMRKGIFTGKKKMATEITSRMREIVNLILTEKCKTLIQIASTLDISLRQLRYNINCVNDILQQSQIPVLEMDNKGKIIVNDYLCLEKFMEMEDNCFKSTKKQRLRLLMVICAFNIEKMNLNRISKELGVTRTTVKTDLSDIKNTLMKYNIELYYDNGFYLSGEKKQIFAFRCDALYLMEYTLYKKDYEKIELLMAQYVSESFRYIKMRKILKIIGDFLDKNDLSTNDSYYYWLASTILLILWYKLNNFEIEAKDIKNITMLEIDFSPLYLDLESFFGITLDLDSQYQISAAFSFACNTIDNKKEKTNLVVVKYILGLISFLYYKLGYNFSEDETCIRGLYYHLERCYKKQEIDVCIPCLNISNIEVEKELSDLILEYCQANKDIIRFDNQQEFELLKLHFASVFYREKLNRKKVLLISGASKNIKDDLRKTLEAIFDLKIVDSVSKYDLPFYDEWDKIDIVLFTENIPKHFNIDIPMLKIDVIISVNDYFELNKLGILPKKNIIDLHSMYQELSFLNYSEKGQVMDILNHYLTGSILPNREKSFTRISSNDIIKKDDFVNSTLFDVGENLTLSFCQNRNEKMYVYIDRDKEKLVLEIMTYQPVRMISLLLTYQTLCKSHILKELKNLTDKEILDVIKSI